MKLLSRAQITEKKNAERLLEIKDGVKLANRVDALRSTAASEEARLEAYRLKSTTFTLEQIDELLAKQRIAEEDLAKAQAEAKRLRQPLDTEWTKLDESIAEHEAEKKVLQGDRLVLMDKLILVQKREETLDEMEQVLTIKDAASEDRNTEANRLYAQAIAAKEATERDAVKHARLFTKRESEVGGRENLVSTREHDADERDKKLLSREKAVRDEAKRVRDLYETYLRTGKYGKRKQR